MRKLTTILLAGLLLTASVLFISATVGTAQIQEQENEDILREIPIPKNRVVVTSVLAGRMLDSTGAPISGVWVDCVGPSGTTGFVTGPDGAYRFSLSQTGHYDIRLHVADTSYSPSHADFYVVIPGADFVRY
jgi:hypothetical protein